MSLTYDDQYLLTGGGDGNVFVYKTNFSTSRPSTSHTAKVYIYVRVHVQHTCILIPLPILIPRQYFWLYGIDTASTACTCTCKCVYF